MWTEVTEFITTVQGMMKSQMEWGNYFLSVKWKFSIDYLSFQVLGNFWMMGECGNSLKEFKETFFTNTIIINQWKIKTNTTKD